jgi:hypothetical protein
VLLRLDLLLSLLLRVYEQCVVARALVLHVFGFQLLLVDLVLLQQGIPQLFLFAKQVIQLQPEALVGRVGRLKHANIQNEAPNRLSMPITYS